MYNGLAVDVDFTIEAINFEPAELNQNCSINYLVKEMLLH